MKLNHHNSRLVWTGDRWERKQLCDNAATNTAINYGRGIGVSQCYDGLAEYDVTVYYHGFESDSFYLCGECLKELKKSRRKHGYKIRSKKIRRQK